MNPVCFSQAETPLSLLDWKWPGPSGVGGAAVCGPAQSKAPALKLSGVWPAECLLSLPQGAGGGAWMVSGRTPGQRARASLLCCVFAREQTSAPLRFTLAGHEWEWSSNGTLTNAKGGEPV